MDLEQAAHTAVAMMRRLLEALSAARSVCSDALADVTTCAQRLDTDRAELDQALTGLEHDLSDLDGTMSQKMAELAAAFASLSHAAAAVGSDAVAALDAESAALRQWVEAVDARAPELDGLAAAAEAGAQEALAHAGTLEETLRQTMDDAEQLLSTGHGSFLARLGETSATRSEQVESVLSRACVAMIEDREQAVQRKAQAVRELLDSAFDRMATHVDSLVTEVLDGCAARVGQVVEDAATLGSSLESGLLDLETAVGTAASALDSVHLPDRLLEISQAAQGAAERVVSLRELWRSQGFGN